MVQVVYKRSDRPRSTDPPEHFYNKNMKVPGVLEAKKSGLLLWLDEKLHQSSGILFMGFFIFSMVHLKGYC